MKKSIIKSTLLLSFASFAAFAFTSSQKVKKKKAVAEVKYVLDAKESSIKWVGKKLTGEHWGTVQFASGSMSFKSNMLTGGSTEIDMSSIDCLDLNGEKKEKLNKHLKDPDFFDTQHHPKATLLITGIKKIGGASGMANNYTLSANLTIKAITKPITFDAHVFTTDKGEAIANAEFAIDRTEFDIRYKSTKFFPDLGDKVIDDKFMIKVRMLARKS